MSWRPPGGERVPVAVLGATGVVGQRIVQLLADHPWFEPVALAASDRSAGRCYAEACVWHPPEPMPEAVRRLPVVVPEELPPVPLAFSALDAATARRLEPALAAAGTVVVSNASSHRMDADVPLIVPEVNADHLALLDVQRRSRGWSGALVTNPNCSVAALVLALAPLQLRFGLLSVHIATLQALSGAGYPGTAALDAMANVLPRIPGEEEKIETETGKILGRLRNGAVEPLAAVVTAQATRVPVVDGHTALVFMRLDGAVDVEEVREALAGFRAHPQELGLPSAPARPIVVLDDPDRPQPRLDVGHEGGMAAVVGRLRPCPAGGFKLVLLGHNTMRGAAGAALLNAELLLAEGRWPAATR
ncbi:MAG: aspartate-semialdehyde dehydrogenase [Thermoanaerobaculia bacterium]